MFIRLLLVLFFCFLSFILCVQFCMVCVSLISRCLFSLFANSFYWIILVYICGDAEYSLADDKPYPKQALSGGK